MLIEVEQPRCYSGVGQVESVASALRSFSAGLEAAHGIERRAICAALFEVWSSAARQQYGPRLAAEVLRLRARRMCSEKRS